MPTQPVGIQNYSLVATDVAGNESTPATLQVTFMDTNAPTTPTIGLLATSDSGASNTDNVTNDTTPTIRLTSGDPSDLLTVTLGGNAILSGVSAGDYTLPTQSTGERTYEVRATNVVGIQSDPASLTVTYDVVPPSSVALDLLASSDTGMSNTDNITSDTTPEMELSSSDPNARYNLTRGGTSVLTDVAGGNHILPEQPEGVQNYSLVAFDVAGNQSAPAALAVEFMSNNAPDTPTIDLLAGSDSGASSTDNITNDLTPTIRLSAGDASDMLTLTLDGNAILTNVAEGIFTLPQQAEGVRTYEVQATNIAGIQSGVGSLTVTYDTTAPNSVVLDLLASSDTGMSDTDNITSDLTPEISLSSSDNNASYDLTRGGSSVLADVAGGTYELPPQPVGVQNYSLVATDLAGNASTPETLSVEYMNANGDIPGIDLLGSSDSGVSNSDDITNDLTPTILLTSANSTDVLTVTLDGNAILTDVAAGQYTLPQQTEGARTYEVQATNIGGVQSPVATLTITLDVSAPSSVFLDLETDTGQSGSDNITNTVTPVMSFGSDDGFNDRFDLSRVGSSGFILGDIGAVSAVLPPQPEGTQTYNLVARDVAGNEVTTSLVVTYDFTGPASVTLDLASGSDTGTSSSDNITSEDTPFMNFGSDELSDRFDLSLAGSAGFFVENSGAATTLLPTQAEGDQTYNLVATDVAGNETLVSLDVTYDFTAPIPILDLNTDTGRSSTDNITNDSTPLMSFWSGDATDRFDLSVVGSAGFLFQDRTALTALLPPQSEGTQTYNLVATDLAGNEATTSLDVTYDFTAPDDANLDLNTDTGRSSTDNITNSDVPVISFWSGDVNDRFDLLHVGNPGFLFEDRTSLTAQLPPQPEGTQTYNLVTEDLAGNESTISLDVTYDFTAPIPNLDLNTDTAQSSTDNVTNSSTPLVLNQAKPDLRIL